MQSKEIIKHQGIIKEKHGRHLKVEILQVSACGSCEARKHCYASEVANKIIDVYTDNTRHQTGDRVTVQLRQDLALKALLIAYMIPFITMLLVLMLSYVTTKNELISGLMAIATLIPYFILLSVFKKKLQRMYSFSLAEDYL